MSDTRSRPSKSLAALLDAGGARLWPFRCTTSPRGHRLDDVRRSDDSYLGECPGRWVISAAAIPDHDGEPASRRPAALRLVVAIADLSSGPGNTSAITSGIPVTAGFCQSSGAYELVEHDVGISGRRKPRDRRSEDDQAAAGVLLVRTRSCTSRALGRCAGQRGLDSGVVRKRLARNCSPNSHSP